MKGPESPAFSGQHSGRRELAEWLVSDRHPLTSRVLINRIWRWHFGRGLVASTDNFGLLGEKPSHPELLDWLAREFIRRKWSLKEMHRLILRSNTYQQSTLVSSETAMADPDNRLWSRFPVRRLAAEELGLATSPYRFADDFASFATAVREVGLPCVVKPVMSSSGKGQSVLRSEAELQRAWDYAQAGGRAGAGRVIVEGFIDFDYEITLLTVRHAGGTSFCEPIGHLQIEGDYRESWQPQPMSPRALAEAQHIAQQVTAALGGWGIFGVELFVKGDEVWFSEVSPRPHDTGLVTLISQQLSEFALHARAILGLPVPAIRQHGPGASCALLVKGDSVDMRFGNLGEALAQPDTNLELFGKPEVHGSRRLGVGLALGASIEEARAKARNIVAAIRVEL